MSIEVHMADITLLEVDCIVNAANHTLSGGGGVDGAIHRAAGPGLRHECLQLPQLRPGIRCATGEVQVTGGHGLGIRHVFHTVGPLWRDGRHDEQALLANCYWNCLKQAERLQLHSIAFPAISCGAYGFPVHLACRIAATETVAWQKAHCHPLRILLVAANNVTAQAFQQSLASLGCPGSIIDQGHFSPNPGRRRGGDMHSPATHAFPLQPLRLAAP